MGETWSVSLPLLPCPLYELTGLWCPGCGLTRATLALVRGDLGAAFGHNVLWPLFAGAIVVGVLAARQGVRQTGAMRWLLQARSGVLAGAILLTFGVLRNLGPFAALAP